MNEKKVSIAVIGAGAIGGVTAARLTRAGWNVEVVCKHPAARWSVRSKVIRAQWMR